MSILFSLLKKLTSSNAIKFITSLLSTIRVYFSFKCRKQDIKRDSDIQEKRERAKKRITDTVNNGTIDDLLDLKGE